VLHPIVNGCYAHSSIPALAFHLATVITKLYGMMHFRHSEMTQQSGDSFLPLNIWQSVIKKNTKKSLTMRLLQRCRGSGQYATDCTLESIKWSDSNKGICNL